MAAAAAETTPKDLLEEVESVAVILVEVSVLIVLILLVVVASAGGLIRICDLVVILRAFVFIGEGFVS